MARARNIKPSFFTNEQLADSCPLGRLLFIGMWTMADYKGDFEWKERTLKIQLLPWDDCSVKELAITLDKSGLIRFYSDGVKTYIHIPNFEKHQNPHKNERDKGSDIPFYSDELRQVIDLDGLTINRDISGAAQESSHSDRADSLLLNPDSLLLNPDPPLLNPESVSPKSQQVAPSPQAAQPKKESKRAHRLPTDWRPGKDHWDEAVRLNPDCFTREWFIETAHKFKDYWIAKSGKDATKADWLATWRSWVRRDVENLKSRGGRYAANQQNNQPSGIGGGLAHDDTSWADGIFGVAPAAGSSPAGGFTDQHDLQVIESDIPCLAGSN